MSSNGRQIGIVGDGALQQESPARDGAVDGYWYPVVMAVVALVPFVALIAPNDRVIPDNVYCDYTTYQLPIREFTRDEILSGRFPLWVPYLACGLPLHASQQAAVCHPLLTPLVIVCGANYGIRLCLFLHLGLCFAGQYCLARSIGTSRAASSLAALIATQSAYMVSHLMEGHVNHILALGVVPWLFLTLVHHLRNPTTGNACVLALLGSCLLLTGHPQIPYYTVLAGGFWWTGSLAVGTGSAHRLRCIVWMMAAIVLALLISSVQIIPAFELIRDNGNKSSRGTVEYATELALTGIDLLLFIMPNLRGNPFIGIGELSPPYFFHERVGYVGLIPLMLTVVALTRRATTRWDLGAGIFIILSIVIALGVTTPLFRLLGTVLPGLFYFRCPGRIFSITAIFAGLLAARGFDAAIRGDPRAGAAHLIGFCAALCVGLNSVLILALEDATALPWKEYVAFAERHLMGDFLVTALLACTSAAAIAACKGLGRSSPTIARLSVLAIAVFDLGYYNVANFYVEDRSARAVPDSILQIDPPIRFIEAQYPQRLLDVEIRYSRAVGLAIGSRRVMLGTNEGNFLPGATERLFSVLQADTPRALAVSACDFCYDPSTNSWLKNSDVAHRCRFLPESHARLSQVSIEDLAPGEVPSIVQPSSVRPRILSDTSQSVEIDLDAPSAGLLVLADTAYPGWQCFVDDQLTPIERVHGMFRGVHVRAGQHRVTFSFNSQSFRYGCLLSSVGIALAIAQGIMAKRGRS